MISIKSKSTHTINNYQHYDNSNNHQIYGENNNVTNTDRRKRSDYSINVLTTFLSFTEKKIIKFPNVKFVHLIGNTFSPQVIELLII